ncbi:MAG: hypothetical protein ACK59M_15965, partial [Pseudomonadota bacterium]
MHPDSAAATRGPPGHGVWRQAGASSRFTHAGCAILFAMADRIAGRGRPPAALAALLIALAVQA